MVRSIIDPIKQAYKLSSLDDAGKRKNFCIIKEGDEVMVEDNFHRAFEALIREHYVPRQQYDALQRQYDALQAEFERSRELFHRKADEWHRFKETLTQRKRPSTPPVVLVDDLSNPESARRKQSVGTNCFFDDINGQQPPRMQPLAPRLHSKAARRLLAGGNTPPDFWATRFTPDPPSPTK